MAEDLGTRELGMMVRSQRLDELLTTLRHLHNPSASSRLGVPALDRLLATNTPRFDPTNLSSVPAPPIIEITSPVPKSGKTELLYWIIAQLVVGDLTDRNAQHYGQTNDSTKDDRGEASDHDGDGQSKNQEHQNTNSAIDPGVQQPTHPHNDEPNHQTNRQDQTHPTAIALLTTTPISISRLAQIILHQTRQHCPTTTLKEAQDLTHTALSHIHIFQPTSLPSLISTLSTLPSYFLSPANPSFDRNLVIILDSASAYFWDDKVTTTAAAGGQKQGLVGKYPALASVLKRSSGQLQAAVLYTTENISPTTTTSTSTSVSAKPQGQMASKPALPTPWSAVPSLRVIISRHSIPGFNKDVDAATAVEQREARDRAVGEAGFEVAVNQWGNQGWTDDRATQSFELKINNEGINMA